jgi:hypothetical protein
VVTAPDIPGHRVGGILGAGGFATVYRCWQLAVGREVAVKVDNRVLLTERDRRRFLREVTAAGRLSGHPPRFAADGKQPGFATIMTLHDKPVEDVPGTPPGLRALLRAGLSPDPAARPQIAVELRDALADGPAGTGPRAQAAAADVFGIPTKSAGCPAAAVRVARARCPASPECFGGITIISGDARAESVGCDRPHYWETFAIAILPADVRTFDQPVVAADPTVRRVCSRAVMLASRQGPARRLPAPDWDIAVLPPSETAFDSGSHVYRCLASEIGHQPRTSQFRR